MHKKGVGMCVESTEQSFSKNFEKQERRVSKGVPIIIERAFVRISKQHGFKPPILKEIVFLRSKGFNNVEIASSVGVSRNTVSNYLERLREMHDEEMAEMISLVGMMMERHSRMMKLFEAEFEEVFRRMRL